MKNKLEGINSRITEAEEQIGDLEDRKVEIIAIVQKKRMKRNEANIRGLWDIKHINIQIIGVKKKKRREKAWEDIWRHYSQKLPYYGKANSKNV